MPYSNSEFDAIVELSGGFGNQLFQYAFGMHLAAVHGRRVAFDTTFYKKANSVAHNRLRLVEYGFDVPTVANLPNGLQLARRLKRLPFSVQQALVGMAYVKCPATRFMPVSPQSGLTYFAGLWHSPHYFETISDQVRTDFRSRLLAAGNYEYAPLSGTVGFHVRRGDYLTHKQSYNLDYPSYLMASYSKLMDMSGKRDWQVRIFTDDPDWCEVNLTLPNLEVCRGGGMLDDFQGLMQCEHKIISNSTFAWWAAFLGEPGIGFVFAPKRWHSTGDSHEAKILGRDWIVVDA